jgi:ribosomal protein S6--L-glutamate ligase
LTSAKHDTNPIFYQQNSELRAHYSDLRQGDIFIGRVRVKPNEEYLFLDLVERGVILFPSALSQQICRSKTAQVLLFKEFMLPHTLAIHDQHEMLEAVNSYHQHAINQVVTKLDRKDGGLGVHLWSTIEDAYNQASLGSLPYPFVLQPYFAKCMDIRVILLDSYEEAYQRENPCNFRNNLHCGGISTACILSKEQKSICMRVMKRGKFPYAHIDLMVTESGQTYLTEINLRGGIKGATISPEEYRERVEGIHANFLKKI